VERGSKAQVVPVIVMTPSMGIHNLFRLPHKKYNDVKNVGSDWHRKR
jgi:hypothetical protein